MRGLLLLLLPYFCLATHPYAFEPADPKFLRNHRRTYQQISKRRGAAFPSTAAKEQSRSQWVDAMSDDEDYLEEDEQENPKEMSGFMRKRNFNERPALNATFGPPSLSVPRPNRPKQSPQLKRKKVKVDQLKAAASEDYDYYEDIYEDYMYRSLPKMIPSAPKKVASRRSSMMSPRKYAKRRGGYRSKKGEAAKESAYEDYDEDYYNQDYGYDQHSRRQGGVDTDRGKQTLLIT